MGVIEESNFLDKVLIEVFFESGCDLYVVDKVIGWIVLYFVVILGNVIFLNCILD